MATPSANPSVHLPLHWCVYFCKQRRTVKARVAEEAFPETLHAQQAQVLGILEGLKRTPATVARLFAHPLVRYASRAM